MLIVNQQTWRNLYRFVWQENKTILMLVSIDPEDWEPGITADQIFNRVVKQVKQGAGHVILLHDAGGDTRKETIKVLPRIIEYFQKRGYKFVTLEDILQKKRDQLMPNVEKGKEYYAMQANLALVTATYDIIQFLTAMFIIFIILGIGRLLFMVCLTIKERRGKTTATRCKYNI